VTPEDPVGRRMQSIAVRAAQAVPLVAGTAEPGNARTSHAAAGRPTVDEVNGSKEIREFLVSRRARVTPQQAGLPAYGTNRRVAGLRREEVAMLAVNTLGAALYAPVFDDPVRPANTARFTFLSPQAKDFYRDWDRTTPPSPA